jgi:glycosyltransferase involved in cell wall biosynthesis
VCRKAQYNCLYLSVGLARLSALTSDYPFRVDVIIPVYQGEKYIVQTIESVLAQTQPASAILVIDDGSTDGTRQLVQQFAAQVRYVYQDNQGASAAKNRGVELAQAPYIAFLDADDLWSANKLERQMIALHNDPTLDLVFGHVQQFHSPELSDAMKAQIECPSAPMPGYSAGTQLTRRDTFERVGKFNQQWRSGEFMDWYLRAIELGLTSHMLPDVVLHRRLHETNHGITARDTRGDYHRILKASLDRRRKQAQHAKHNE